MADGLTSSKGHNLNTVSPGREQGHGQEHKLQSPQISKCHIQKSCQNTKDKSDQVYICSSQQVLGQKH